MCARPQRRELKWKLCVPHNTQYHTHAFVWLCKECDSTLYVACELCAHAFEKCASDDRLNLYYLKKSTPKFNCAAAIQLLFSHYCFVWCRWELRTFSSRGKDLRLPIEREKMQNAVTINIFNCILSTRAQLENSFLVSWILQEVILSNSIDATFRSTKFREFNLTFLSCLWRTYTTTIEDSRQTN